MGWFFRRKHRQNSTTSISDPTSILRSTTVPEQFVGDRRFVNTPDAPYQLPKDLTDLNRLDFQHFILRQSFAGNYLAPVTLGAGSQILDVGTGTGRWCVEMAQAFPQAQIFGIDLEEARDITGQNQMLPPNYHFQVGNVLQGLSFLDGTFDFVHQRLLVTGIPFARWFEVVQELLRVTRPGGWIEMIEGGGFFVNDGPATQQWCSWSNDLMKPAGIDIYQIAHLGAIAEQAGLVCENRVYSIPLGAWGGRIGTMLQQDLLSIYESLVPRYHKVLGISPVSTDMMRQNLLREWEDLRTQLSIFVLYGQK